MKALLVPDKFKDSLTATEVIESIRLGVLDHNPDAETYAVLASDGGDGFLEAVRHYLDLEEVFVETVDPLGRPIRAQYAFEPKNSAAYIELAKASGIELLTEAERKVMKTSTYGTGLQIRDAIDRGATTIFLGLGGSATNDAATGIATALGYIFVDQGNDELIVRGEALSSIHAIKKDDSLFGHVRFVAVNDVQNPLYGPQGAAYTYARQKGATDSEIAFLDRGLTQLSEKVKEQLDVDVAHIPGSGAAGGTGYGLKAFLNAEFVGGTHFILGLSRFHEILDRHKIDCIITGEGKIDSQTAHGKLVHGIITEGKKRNIPVLAVCGKLGLDPDGVTQLGLAAAVELYDPKKPVSYSYDNAARLVRSRVAELLNSFLGQ